MPILLKVTPKGQVTLPKKVRDQLGVGDLAEVTIQGTVAILKKAERKTDTLAGCFRSYAQRAGVPVEKAMGITTEMVADEVAKKSR
jgi:AbrB family looped-hinge helix DNA binding protein